MLPHKKQSQEQNYFLKVPKNPIPQSEKLNEQKKTLTDCTENYPFFQQKKISQETDISPKPVTLLKR